jgi:hypothetical protein
LEADMQEPHRTVLKRSVPLWITAFLLMTLNGLAAMLGSPSLTYVALAISGAFALYGIGFGIWVGRKLSKAS